MCYYLHSNLVIFKYFIAEKQKLIESRFTFQSGDIQILDFIKFFRCLFVIYIPIWWYSNHPASAGYGLNLQEFTFQSGDIQIPANYMQYTFEYQIYIPIWWYSNSNFWSLSCASNVWFTFQSGDIQIKV